MLGKGFFLTNSHNPDLPPEEWTLVYEKTTPGTDTFNVGWGRYKIEMSAGGGGSGTALGYDARAGASGGTASYGDFMIEYGFDSIDTLSFNIGAGGIGATQTGGTAGTQPGESTTISDTTHGANFVILNGGGAAYANAAGVHDTAIVGSAGTFSTLLDNHNLHNGIKGNFQSTHSGAFGSDKTINPNPYDQYGYGGAWYYSSSDAYQVANNGGDGFIRIYKSNIKPLKEEVYYAWGSNPSVKETRVFTENLNPQVGDPAWFFGFDNTRTSYDIKDATQVTIQSSGTGASPIVWVDNTGFYAVGTLGPAVYTLNRMSNDDIIIKW